MLKFECRLKCRYLIFLYTNYRDETVRLFKKRTEYSDEMYINLFMSTVFDIEAYTYCLRNIYFTIIDKDNVCKLLIARHLPDVLGRKKYRLLCTELKQKKFDINKRGRVTPTFFTGYHIWICVLHELCYMNRYGELEIILDVFDDVIVIDDCGCFNPS